MPLKELSAKPQIVVIVGLTASGKSELAVKLAKKLNGEIISADSRQVYKYLNLAAGKVEGKWKKLMLLQKNKVLKSQNTKHKVQSTKRYFVYKSIPHYCIDFVNPKEIFTAQDFKKCGEKAIDEIMKKGKTPIIVGGTAFYIYSLTGDIPIPEIPPDWKLREKFEKKPTEELLQMLKKLNPRRAKNIDSKNRRRLIRAIEIAKFGDRGSKIVIPQMSGLRKYNILWLGIKLPDKELKKRIKKRLMERIKEGMIQEIKKIHEKYRVSWKRLEEMGLEMRYVSRHLRGLISKKDMIENINNKTWQFSKRQMTWWKKDKRIKWVSLFKDAEELVQNFNSKFIKT